MKKDSKRGIKRSFCVAFDSVSGGFDHETLGINFLILVTGSMLSLGTARILSPNVEFSRRIDNYTAIAIIIITLLIYLFFIRKIIVHDRKHYPKKRQRTVSFRDYGIFILILLGYFVFVGVITTIWLKLSYGS